MMRKVQPSYELHVHRTGRTTAETDEDGTPKEQHDSYFTHQRHYDSALSRSSYEAHHQAGHVGLFVSCPYCHKSKGQTYFPGKDYKYPVYRHRAAEENLSLEARLDREQRRQRQLDSDLSSLKLYWQPTWAKFEEQVEHAKLAGERAAQQAEQERVRAEQEKQRRLDQQQKQRERLEEDLKKQKEQKEREAVETEARLKAREEARKLADAEKRKNKTLMQAKLAAIKKRREETRQEVKLERLKPQMSAEEYQKKLAERQAAKREQEAAAKEAQRKAEEEEKRKEAERKEMLLAQRAAIAEAKEEKARQQVKQQSQLTLPLAQLAEQQQAQQANATSPTTAASSTAPQDPSQEGLASAVSSRLVNGRKKSFLMSNSRANFAKKTKEEIQKEFKEGGLSASKEAATNTNDKPAEGEKAVVSQEPATKPLQMPKPVSASTPKKAEEPRIPEDETPFDRMVREAQSVGQQALKEREEAMAAQAIEKRHLTPEELRTNFRKFISTKPFLSKYMVRQSSTPFPTWFEGTEIAPRKDVLIEKFTEAEFKKKEECFFVEWLISNNKYFLPLKEIYCNNHHHFLVREMAEEDLFAQIEVLDGGVFDELEVKNIVSQAVQAVKKLHEFGYYHRDIKAESFAARLTDDCKIELQLTNFLSVTNAESSSDPVGVVSNMAPEMAEGKQYNHLVDIWSLGVLTYTLLCGFLPFDGNNDEETKKAILKNKVEFPSPEWDNISDPAKLFVSMCLEKNPAKRADISKLYSHRWLSIQKPFEELSPEEQKSEMKKKYKKREEVYCETTRDYEGNTEDKELSFKKGERIMVIDRPEDDWWWGQKDDGTVGYFPTEYAPELRYRKVKVKNTNLSPAIVMMQKLLKEQGGGIFSKKEEV